MGACTSGIVLPMTARLEQVFLASEKDLGLLDNSCCSSGFHMADAAAGVLGHGRVPLQVGVPRHGCGVEASASEGLPTWMELRSRLRDQAASGLCR